MRSVKLLNHSWLGFFLKLILRYALAFHARDDDDDRYRSSLEGHLHSRQYFQEKPHPMRTGTYPIFKCPKGHYRDLGDPFKRRQGGILMDGCIKCPKGHYGNSTDLKSPKCTSPCPKGTFLDRKGGTSILDCTQCPEGTYGEKDGLITSRCSGSCSDHNTNQIKFFSNRKGLTTRDDCKVCPKGYFGWQCLVVDRHKTRKIRAQQDQIRKRNKEEIFNYSSYLEKRNHTSVP